MFPRWLAKHFRHAINRHRSCIDRVQILPPFPHCPSWIYFGRAGFLCHIWRYHNSYLFIFQGRVLSVHMYINMMFSRVVSIEGILTLQAPRADTGSFQAKYLTYVQGVFTAHVRLPSLLANQLHEDVAIAENNLQVCLIPSHDPHVPALTSSSM